MRLLSLVLFVLFLPTLLFAQGADGEEFGIKFKGFVKTDFMLDTRANISAREGHFLLYPAEEVLDMNGDDINATPNLNMLSIQTRLTGVISAPDAFGAKVSGLVEGAFFGHSNGDINGFRLRHAFVKLAWDRCSLIVGQYWHPMFITEVFPGVVSFSTGVPMQPFSRNPQIRYIHKMNNIFITLTAASQRDFTDTGPSGGSSIYLRNAVLPILNMNVKMKSDNLVIGAGANYKSLMPRTSTLRGLSTDEKISSTAMIGFAKITSGNMTIKAEGVYGENMYDLFMLGGYAVKSDDGEYIGIKTMSSWGEFVLKMSESPMTLGLFGGYTKNLGADDDILPDGYVRGKNIDAIMRVSPRIIYQIGKTRFAAEVEYTSAAYGSTQTDGTVEDTESVSNIRFLLAAYLFF
ncbi:MAG: hypothetical protein B6244_13935 [Candidatus Cloacimonetes bacterium 4572_55]|nr:MAG: hypothetical protein B6244_13935 [Candidatus Cloacimonetes bacterium 4572_55]